MNIKFEIWRKVLIAFVISVLMLPALALAETDPRGGIPAPGGTDVFLFYMRSYSGNNYYQHGKKVSSNADLNTTLAMARYVHYFTFDSLDKWTFAANLIQPFGSMNFESGATEDRTSGLGDTTFQVCAFTPNLIDEENNKYRMVLGLYVTAPTGEYHSEKSVNLGANRWAYKFEFTPLVWQLGPLVLEQTNNIKFYTDNDDYSSAHLKQKKDPLYAIICHASYDFSKTFFGGISYLYHNGGETEINGNAMDDETKTHTLKFTGGITLTPQTRLLLQYVTDVEVENGVGTNYIGCRLSHAF